MKRICTYGTFALCGLLLNACGSLHESGHPPEARTVAASPLYAVPSPGFERRPAVSPPENRDQFQAISDNPVHRVSETPVSTFSADVDTASYSFSRRQLSSGYWPDPNAVRVEEWLNYFDYNYPVPNDASTPFSAQVAVTDSPWKAGNKLVHIGIQGYELESDDRPRANLVFLLDVSGSMGWSDDKLPLLKQALKMMLKEMAPDDTVAIVVYAGASGVVLPATPVADSAAILQALNQLEAGGSTAGGEGIELAYELAESNFDNDAVNRVLLATDGDFNVGVTDREALKALVSRKRERGIYLSVLGFGAGNYDDYLMQSLAQNGNGVAAYIDTLSEARKVLVTESSSSLFPIADDLKLQVEFNPDTVLEYRLLGYETRSLAREDFNNDAVDAGDIGAGHSVTAIYEITPVGGTPLISESRYAEREPAANRSEKADEYGFLQLRYKRPGESKSRLVDVAIPAGNTTEDSFTEQQDIAFATAVAGAAQLLRGGKYTGDWGLDDAIELAQANRGEDSYGYRAEFVQLLRMAKASQ